MKEAIHIHKEDPELNRNVGKIVIPCVFDPILCRKPKNPCISSLLSQESGFQDIGKNLMQFHSFIDKRVTRAQRARNSNSSKFYVFFQGMNWVMPLPSSIIKNRC